MAAATSPATGRRYGVAKVCRIWEVPRSSFYAVQRQSGTAMPPSPTGRRGPRPAATRVAVSNPCRPRPVTLASEGHRKVWARLRVMDGIRVSRKRVPRLMREHTLIAQQVVSEAAHEGGAGLRA